MKVLDHTLIIIEAIYKISLRICLFVEMNSKKSNFLIKLWLGSNEKSVHASVS